MTNKLMTAQINRISRQMRVKLTDDFMITEIFNAIILNIIRPNWNKVFKFESYNFYK